ncbi:hypothetical protein LLH00_05020 [bacterium]|nr:hypothetical protein [bacterium]
MNGQSRDEEQNRLHQCEYDLENNSGAGQDTGAYSSPYICAVCGAGARDASNLCAPERGDSRGRGLED